VVVGLQGLVVGVALVATTALLLDELLKADVGEDLAHAAVEAGEEGGEVVVAGGVDVAAGEQAHDLVDGDLVERAAGDVGGLGVLDVRG
jgi:hypothetical protein